MKGDFYMNTNKKQLSLAIFLTIILTLTATFSFSYGWNYFHPKYSISFDAQKVNINNINKFEQVKKILQESFYEDIDENVMLEGAIAGLAYSLKDPYTAYYTKEQMTKMTESLSGRYTGIGVRVMTEADGLLTMIEVFDQSPAKLAGVLPGDKVVTVDGKEVAGLDEDVIISMIRGEENTIVKISMFRTSINKVVDFEITRKKLKTPNMEASVLSDDIGFIRIKDFDAEVANDFNINLNKMLLSGIKGLIIDVRDNPGGYYDQVVAIANRLLPAGTIVYTEDRNKVKVEQKSDSKELGLPLTILINGRSASASEVLAGAIKDFKKGTLIGTKSFGKGLVQRVIPLEDGSGIKVTIERYFTPSGVSIHGTGIQPDIEVKLDAKYDNYSVSTIPKESDEQLKTAIEVIKKQIK